MSNAKLIAKLVESGNEDLAEQLVALRLVDTAEGAMADGSINSFLTVLAAHLTQWDMKESRKHFNAYRLGHLLEAKDRVEQAVKSKLKSAEHADLEMLKKVLAKIFDPKLPPVKKTIKDIDKFLQTGKPPKYPVTKKS